MSYILLDTSKSQAAQIAELVSDAIKLRESAARVRAWANEITAGGATASNLETTAYGVPTGAGQEIYDTITSIKSGVDGINGASLASLDQG